MNQQDPTSGRLMLDASRAAFWNVVVLPTLAVLNLAFAVILRRSFGLYSGVYDVLLGVLATLLLWSTFGIPSSLTKFLPELDGAWSRAGIARFLRRVILVRFALLVAVLVPLNLFSDWLAEVLSLGAEGPALLRLLSALVVLRAGLDLIAKILNSYFAQLWTNLILLGQSLFDFLLVGVILFAGYQMRAVIGALLVSSAISVVWGADRVRRMLGGKRRAGDEAEVTPEPIDELFDTERPRFIRFATFTYTYELTVYLAGMAFVGPALAIVLDSEQVALFATAFKLALTTVSLVVVGFRGVYRPFFVRLRMAGDAEQLRRGFAVVSKAQLVLLLPTGVWLAVLSGDLIPLLFGSEFLPAVPVARVLITLLFVGNGLQSRQYRAGDRRAVPRGARRQVAPRGRGAAVSRHGGVRRTDVGGCGVWQRSRRRGRSRILACEAALRICLPLGVPGQGWKHRRRDGRGRRCPERAVAHVAAAGDRAGRGRRRPVRLGASRCARPGAG